MELWQEIINKEINDLTLDKSNVENFLESKCYKALSDIKNIIQNSALSDKECFYKIEEIVCVLEELGSNGGGRHDF